MWVVAVCLLVPVAVFVAINVAACWAGRSPGDLWP